MAEYEQAGGSPIGQTTSGPNSRKLTQGEVNYRPKGGVPGLRCSECRFYQGGDCQIVEGPIVPEGVCDMFEPATVSGHMSTEEATETRNRPLSALELFITRVSTDKQTKKRHWYATSSGVKRDAYGERMSVALYRDFIRRIEDGERAPDPFISSAWSGGLPYLGVAHYLDLDGYNIVGPTEQVWIDGNTLKAKGGFTDGPLADAIFKAIQDDIAQKRPDNERIRISIAFVDWAHNHGPKREFVRQSLSDRCMLCAAGVDDKEYTAGQLVHLATTRRPAYPETEIVALEERAMTDKRHEDAASQVGEELAEELRNRSKELLATRSAETADIDPSAIVIKAEENQDSALGGATTIEDAEAYLQEKSAGGQTPLFSGWNVLGVVLGNIAGDPAKAQAIREALGKFQQTFDVQAAEAVLAVQRALGGSEVSDAVNVANQVVEREGDMMNEEEKKKMMMAEEEEKKKKEAEAAEEKSIIRAHPLDEAYAQLRDAYDTAVASGGTEQERIAIVQESFNEFGSSVKSSLSSALQQASGGFDMAAITRAMQAVVSEAVAPIAAEVAALRAGSLGAGPVVPAGVPGRRAIRMPPSAAPFVTKSVTEQPAPASPTPKLRALVRRSTVEFEQRRQGLA